MAEARCLKFNLDYCIAFVMVTVDYLRTALYIV